jgi:hypothetical protein
VSAPARVANKDADEGLWLEARARGVTATDVHALAQGGASTRDRILKDKQNGAAFGGNQHTARGHRREPIIAEWVERKFGIKPNSWLLAGRWNMPYFATPDGFGMVVERFGGGEAGAEIKSHAHGWEAPATIVPAEHYDQCQWGMFVTEVDRWLYVWEVMEADGFAPVQPEWLWIERDEERIATLRAEADSFIAWRENGAQRADLDIPAELDEAISAHVKARRRKIVAEHDEKAAEVTVRRLIAAEPGVELTGTKHSGADGQLVYSVKTEKQTAIDFAAWKKSAPLSFAAYSQEQQRIADREAEAFELYPMTTEKTSTRLVITAHKTEEA